MSLPVTLKSELPRAGATALGMLVLLVFLNVVLGIGAMRYVICSKLDSDEVEHGHVTWALGQGIMPYRDIHQIHTPSLWLVCAPIMKRLPASVESMTAMRMVCLLAFAGAYVAGLLVLREIFGPITRIQALLLLLLSLSVFAVFQFYRYRPDPLMCLCTAYAIVAAVRLGRAPVQYSILGGIALGLAASFSPKMAPLCLLVPAVCLLECRRQRSLRPLWLVIPNGLGFVAGVMPAAAWIVSHGLFDRFRDWTITANSHTLNFCQADTLEGMASVPAILALAVAGGVLLVRIKPDVPRTSWSPKNGLLVATFLAWLIPLIEPNHMIYNFQAFAMPAAVLGTVPIMKLAALDVWPWGLRFMAVGAVLLAVVQQPIVAAIDAVEPGVEIARSDLQKLADLCRSDDATCIGFAPWHPLFCRDATDLYLGWDLEFPVVSWVSAAGKQQYRDMWPPAIAAIERGQPSLIVDQQFWGRAYQYKIISKTQYDRFLRAVKAGYEPVCTGGVTAWVRKGSPKLGLSPTPRR